jgi:hypothetical protein
MRQAGSVDVFWTVLALGICAALVYLGYRMEPHYVSKDGRRFLCTGRKISAHGEPEGRKREVRFSVLTDGRLRMDVKRGLRRTVSDWSVEGKSPTPPSRRAVYVLRGENTDGGLQRMIIQMPSKSRVVEILDNVLADTR